MRLFDRWGPLSPATAVLRMPPRPALGQAKPVLAFFQALGFILYTQIGPYPFLRFLFSRCFGVQASTLKAYEMSLAPGFNSRSHFF